MNKYQKIINKTVKNLRNIEELENIVNIEGKKEKSYYKARKGLNKYIKDQAKLNRAKRTDYNLLKVVKMNSRFYVCWNCPIGDECPKGTGISIPSNISEAIENIEKLLNY